MELRFVRFVFCLYIDIFFLTKKSLKYMMWLLQIFVLSFLCSFFWNMLRKGRNSLSNLHVLLKMPMVDWNMILAALAFWWVMFNKKLEIELSINGRRYWYVLQPAGILSCKGILRSEKMFKLILFLYIAPNQPNLIWCFRGKTRYKLVPPSIGSPIILGI